MTIALKMPPRAQTNVLRGRGRPKRAAADEASPAPVANASEKKRGRVAKVDAVDAPAEPPKKRGRPAKVQQEEPVTVLEAPRRSRRSLVAPEAPVEAAKKRLGRPAKKEVVEAPATATAPKKHAARSNKSDADVPAAPKPRGRPPRNAAAVDLSRVAGSSRVIKSRSKPAPRATAAAIQTAPVPRMDPRMRSKLRTRAPPAQKAKEDVAPQPTKRRGRPPKTNIAAVQAPSPKKHAGRKATKAAVSKPIAPRKKRGYTTLDIPDKFAAQVRQYIQELEDADSLPTPAENEAEPETGAEEAAANAEDEYEDENEDEEGGGDVVIEEEVFVTSATASADLEGALTSEANEDQDLNAGGEEEDLQDEYNQDIVDRDSVDESAEPAAEVDLEMGVQGEEVYVDGDTDHIDALAQQGDADMDSPEDDTEVHTHGVESSAAVGFLFN
ncbi:hypothetical protein HBI25_176090 [Parastagonospora nodorum]|nr:hypothetical protein HBH52_141800 [Parastagonospora nodorum]KAH3998841.1 hypothetical protein HBI10_128750 [Parastagonospora nodorum]KAH4023920.1 hypothetical protein HBI13_080800 [Parastagonospora nodorum]KAH4033644.1 hypothetical protein HBI09_111110 [Parastagonospora nodorum]KAH4044453.1 hypothetical protein HBH49_214910 [Parastagonospora nodorum]